jgi:hypothetical protein
MNIFKVKKNIIFKIKGYYVKKLVEKFWIHISQKNIQLIHNFIEESIKNKNKKLGKILFWAITHNQDYELNFSKEKWDYLIQNSDLNQKYINSYNACILTLFYYEKQNLSFTKEQWDYLIRNSYFSENKNDTLKAAILNNKNIQLTKEQWIYLIENSDLKQKDFSGNNIIIYAFRFDICEKLNCKKEIFKKFWDILSEEEKKENFESICLEKIYHQTDKIKKQKNILFILYELEYDPTEETKKLLYEEKQMDSLEIIKKKELFLKINKDLFIKEIQKKVVKI